MSRIGKFLLIVLIPVVLYGGIKGFFYYKAKQMVDRSIANVPGVDVRYEDLSTDLRGAVTVSGITIYPQGYQDSATIDSVRLASDDPMYFLGEPSFGPGNNKPPKQMSMSITGFRMPLVSDLWQDEQMPEDPCDTAAGISPDLLKDIGFLNLEVDIDAQYRFVEAEGTLEMGMSLEMKDIKSATFSATMTDVDYEAVSQGAAPSVSLGDFDVSVVVDPEFGRQAAKQCIVGSDQSVAEYQAAAAQRALDQLAKMGISLGPGLTKAVRDLYRDWGELRVAAKPAQPVGLLSLMFVKPEQLADMLNLQLTVNRELITDTSFSWEMPEGAGLAAVLGQQREEAESGNKSAPQRILVQRAYEPVPVANIAGYVDHKVRVKPRGQPQREGVLKRIAYGEAEIEQTLHGGKYTVYVPVAQIESMQALTQREIPN